MENAPLGDHTDYVCATVFSVVGGDIILDDLIEAMFYVAKRHREGVPGRPPKWMECETYDEFCNQYPERVVEFKEVARIVYESIKCLGYEVVKTGAWLPRVRPRVAVKPRAGKAKSSPAGGRIPRTTPISSKRKP